MKAFIQETPHSGFVNVPSNSGAVDIRKHLKIDYESFPWLSPDSDDDEGHDEARLSALATLLGSAESAFFVWTLCDEIFSDQPSRYERQFYGGHRWIKASLSEWCKKYFTWLTARRLGGITERLEEQGVVIRKQLAEGILDKSYSYTINEGGLMAMITAGPQPRKPAEKRERATRPRPHTPKKPKPSRTPKSPPVHGYVYLFVAENGLHKIGLSKNAERRLKSFQTLPFDVSYVCSIETGDMRGMEASLHARFADKRVKGEWFNLSADDVVYIKSLMGGL